MCIFTHFAAGALAGGVTGNVWIGAGAGFASHAVLDAIPHYDHPDWRLELLGGAIALIILFLLPFGTLPAIVGGIFGMMPDLENLFQKLGKMRRDQFIYPSHTGLIPHGRPLGPRSLGWQVVIFVLCMVLLGLLTPGSTQAQATFAEGTPSYKVVSGDPLCRMDRPVITVLGSTAGNTLIRIDFPVAVPPAEWDSVDPARVKWSSPVYDHSGEIDPEGEPLPLDYPSVNINLAVPATSAVTARLVEATWWKEPVGQADLAALLQFSPPIKFRSVPLSGTQVPVVIDGGIPASLVLEISHPMDYGMVAQWEMGLESDSTAKQTEMLDAVPSGVNNPVVFKTLSRGGYVVAARQARLNQTPKNAKAQIPDFFGLTSRWIRLQIDETGIFSLSGQDILQMGVGTSGIDPAKLRLYRGGGLPLAKDPSLPDSLQIDRASLTEIAIEVTGQGDGEWNLDDEIHFFAFGSRHYLDRLDPTALPNEHFDHPFSAHGYYWLTWEPFSVASPLPGAPLRIATVSAPPNEGEPVSSHRARQHYEQQNDEFAGLFYDGFTWDSLVRVSHPESFFVDSPEAGTGVRVVLHTKANPEHSTPYNYLFVGSAWVNNNTAQGVEIQVTRSSQSDSNSVRFVIDCDEVHHGNNTMNFRNINPTHYDVFGNPTRHQNWALDSYDVLFWTKLELAAPDTQVVFAHWGNQVSAPGTPVDLKLEVDNSLMHQLWDVTNHAAPLILVGQSDGGSPAVMTYGLLRSPESSRHFVAYDPRSLLAVTRGQRVSPAALRAEDPALDYVVIYSSAFSEPGRRLADFHDTYLPGITSPQAKGFSVQDVYDNYSGGQKDPNAIRNFLHDLYLRGGMRLRYVCLLGNASRDYRNIMGREPLVGLYDLVPTEVRTPFPNHPLASVRYWPYASDDGLVSFDPVSTGQLDYPDVACGRLSAISLAEANGMVDRCIAYVTDPEPGLWANNILMVADDNYAIARLGHDPHSFEDGHTEQADLLVDWTFPLSIDVNKIYGVAYPFPPGSQVKPKCRNDIIAALSAGTSIFHYIGHGAEDNLADEQIFNSDDIPGLSNGAKRPVFIAFSCDVGIYDSPSTRSMAEDFMIRDSGGAIGTICASQVSYGNDNDILSEFFYFDLFPGQHVDNDVPVSWALLTAKASMANSYLMANSQRFNYFGDPAMSLAHPADDLQFAASSVDTLRAGARHTVLVAADGKSIFLGAGDQYQLSVQESSHDFIFPNDGSGGTNSFDMLGAPIFRGNGTVGADELGITFQVPVQLQYGDRARVRLLLETPDGSHVAVQRMSAVRSQLGPNNDIVGPDIRLAFVDNRYRVRTGTELTATLHDTSSIAILGTPGSSLELEFDGTGFMTNVTSSFSFDADSYTQGKVVFPLPGDLSLGVHKAALHASDALGNVGNDTLSFEVVPAGNSGIDDVTLFPNPTPGYCRLIFELSDPMDIGWEIYSLSGRRLKTIRETFRVAGPQILHWDGFDDQGDEIANGTYLYVLRGSWSGGRDITKTGKLVIMR